MATITPQRILELWPALTPDERAELVERAERVNPHHGLQTPGKTFRHYPVSKTPFVVVYEYDDAELRVLLITHKRTDRRKLDPRDGQW